MQKPPRKTEFKLKPGILDLFNFKGKGNGPNNPKPGNTNPKEKPNNAWGGNKAAEEKLKAKEAELAKREKALAAKEAQLNGGKGEAVAASGFSQEDSLKIKQLDKNLAKLESLDDEEKALHYPCPTAFEAKINELKQQKQDIWARNRAKLPVAEQHKKQAAFVAKLEGELKEAKDEQQEILDKFREVEEDIKAKTQFLAEKRAELCDLANKVALEANSFKPAEATEATPKPKLGKEHLQLFGMLKSFLARSNVLDMFKNEGATDQDIDIMEHMWTNVSEVVEQSAQTGPLKTPNVPSAPSAASAPSNGPMPGVLPGVKLGEGEATGVKGGTGGLNVPVQLDTGELDGLWTQHLQENPEVAELDETERDRKRQTFLELQRALKRTRAS